MGRRGRGDGGDGEDSGEPAGALEGVGDAEHAGADDCDEDVRERLHRLRLRKQRLRRARRQFLSRVDHGGGGGGGGRGRRRRRRGDE